MAQFGSARDWGSRGRRFNSGSPDHLPGQFSTPAGVAQGTRALVFGTRRRGFESLHRHQARVAQLVERILGKDEVVGSAPTSGPQNTKPGKLNWMSATVLTSRDAGSSPVPGTQFRERCQSPAYWGILLRRWPFTGPGGSNPFLSAHHPLRPWKARRAWSIAPASKAVRVTPTGVQIPRLPLRHLMECEPDRRARPPLEAGGWLNGHDGQVLRAPLNTCPRRLSGQDTSLSS